MNTLISIIVVIVVISLVAKLITWMVKGLFKILPYILAISGIGLLCYGVIYAVQNISVTASGSVMNIVLQVLYFGVVLVIMLMASSFISEILKLIRLRWVMIPLLIILMEVQLTLKAEGYVISNPTSLDLARYITMVMFSWAIFQFIRISRNIGFSDDLDSNIMGYYAGMGGAFGFISLYLLDFPNNLLNTNFNTIIYLNVLVYISLLIGILSINKQVSIYIKVKKYIKNNGYCTINDILANLFENKKDKEKTIFAEQIILKMKKHKFVFEISLKEPIFIHSLIYKYVVKELNLGKDFDEIATNIQGKFKVQLSKNIIEAIYKMTGVKSTTTANLKTTDQAKPQTPHLQKCVPPSISTKSIVDKEVAISEMESSEQVKNLVSVFRAIIEQKSKQNIENEMQKTLDEVAMVDNDNEPYSIIEKEFMILRYNIFTNPIMIAKPKYKTLYYNLLSYIIDDLQEVSTSIKILKHNYLKALGLNENSIEKIDKETAIKRFKEITKREIFRVAFLNYRIRDYRFILILEAFYFRSILKATVEYELIDNYCEMLKIKDKAKEFVINYIEQISKIYNISSEEDLLLSCRNKYILATVKALHENIKMNALYNELPKYNVAVCATMSSGKSTFINALLGKDHMPSKNQACTAKITSIADNDGLETVVGIMFDNKENRNCSSNINLELLEEWNKRDDVQRIMLESNLDGIRSNKGIVVINDTPGTNYSQDESHQNITMSFLKNNEINMLIYLINAEHASTIDNQILLRQIKAEVIEKQAANILFLVNKIDSFDSEKDDDIVLCLDGIKKELIDYGYENPNVIPISANAARLFKMVLKGEALSKRETATFKNLFDLFFNENLDLIKFTDFENKSEVDVGKEELIVTIGNFEYKRADILKALQRTGITLVEKILDDKINN